MNKKISVFVAVLMLTYASVAAQSQNFTLDGIKEQVTVRRDARSIPYIEAKSDADLYFVQGYVTASDRLWQMDLMRRLARGQTAEIFGNATLEEDRRWRRFNFSKVAEDSMQYLSPELQSALESYARGVNAYIVTLNETTLPVEFRILQYKPTEWKSTDTIVIGKILADALSSTWRNDLLKASLQILPKDKLADLGNQVTPYDVVLFGKDAASANITKSAQKSTSVDQNLLLAAEKDDEIRKKSLEKIGLYSEELAASNNWVISGKFTSDGKPILANDPHLQPTAPGIWYLTHLSTPQMRVSGVTFPGIPGIILGHNESIAWGATNVGPDVQDLYVEMQGPEGLKTQTGWQQPIVRKEEIRVRANPLKPDTQTTVLEVVESRNGPVIIEQGDRKYALRWTALDPKNTEFEAFFLMNRARSWDDFRNALKKYGGAAQNFVYADVKGNIGWYAAGKIPIRRTGDGSLPYDGATNDGDWTGYIPFEELPNLYNPKTGLIVTANQRTVGTDYKYFDIMARDAALPWRARRIFDLLNSKTKISMDDVRDVQYDVLNIPVSNLAKQIVKLNAASPETLSVLKTWDGRMTAESEAALLTYEIRGCAANKIADNNKPVPAYLIRERVLYWAVEQQSSRWLPKEFSNYADLLKSCDKSSRESLADPKRYGMDESKWLWGQITKSSFPHPLAIAPLIGGQFATPREPLNGSGQTPNVASFVSMRHIASPGNWDQTRFVIPLGESGDPKSPFFKDQFEAWRTGTPQVFPFSKDAVEKAAKGTNIFLPK